jgi:hypothetical protein
MAFFNERLERGISFTPFHAQTTDRLTKNDRERRNDEVDRAFARAFAFERRAGRPTRRRQRVR